MTPAAHPAPAPLARPSVTVDEFKAQHAHWDDLAAKHRRFCLRCANGRRCATYSEYAGNADAAGWRWELAEQRERREATDTTTTAGNAEGPQGAGQRDAISVPGSPGQARLVRGSTDPRPAATPPTDATHENARRR